MRKIPLSMLTPDMVLARSIYHKNVVLLPAGIRNIGRYIKQLVRLGIFSVYIVDKVSEDIEIPDIVTDVTRMKCKNTLNSAFQSIQDGGIIDVGELNNAVSSLLDEIMQRKDILLSLSDIGTTDDGTLVHSVNVTVYALMLAVQLGYKEVELKVLGEGALLHDIGKIALRQDILYKADKLTSEEYEYVKLHAQLGYEILKKNPLLSELSRKIALNHHERLDGSGYPDNLKGVEIHPFVRIAAVADIFEALTSERCYRRSMPIYKAVEILMQETLLCLDSSIVSTFLQSIAIYPNGSMVLISDGRKAVVVKQNKGYPFRPLIRIVEEENGYQERGEEVDLMLRLDILVRDVIM